MPAGIEIKHTCRARRLGTAMFEITRGKTLVWRYADPSADGTIMSVQMLDAEGRPLPGDTLR